MMACNRLMISLLLIFALGIFSVSCGGENCLDKCTNQKNSCLKDCDNEFPNQGPDLENCKNKCESDYKKCEEICVAGAES